MGIDSANMCKNLTYYAQLVNSTLSHSIRERGRAKTRERNRPQTQEEISALIAGLTDFKIDQIISLALKDAIHLWYQPAYRGDTYQNEARIDARNWILSEDRYNYNSFLNICIHLGFDADLIRDGLRETKSVKEFRYWLKRRSFFGQIGRLLPNPDGNAKQTDDQQ